MAGDFRGRRLIAPAGDTTRPTTDKVREAVFNSLWSMGVLDGAVVVDLFAGSGALGIEALSRGAESCTFVERDATALRALRANLAALALGGRTTVVAADASGWAAVMPEVDLALIDPPYGFADWSGLLGRLRAAYAVCEADREVVAPDGWETLRARRYGRTWVTVLARIDDAGRSST